MKKLFITIFLFALFVSSVSFVLSRKNHTSGPPINEGMKTKYAFLVIDMQKDFLDVGGKLPVDSVQGNMALDTINAILDSVRSENALIVYIGNEFEQSDSDNEGRKYAAIKGSDGSKLCSRLRIVGNTYFAKNQGDAFSNEAFDRFLRDQAVTNLIVTGLYAEHCVLDTIEGGLDRKYAVSVIPEGVATTDNEAHSRAIASYTKKGVNVITLDDAVAVLSQKG